MCTFDVLYDAYLAARRGKRKKVSTAQYEANALQCTEKLAYILRTKKYIPSKFEVFYVYEPKRRLVQAPAFVDKVVLHAVTDNIMYDALTRSFIRDNHASQKGKGTHDGLLRLKGHMIDYYRKHGSAEGWVLKGDVRHFFASIDHDLLKDKLWRVIEKRNVDPQIYELLCTYIDTTEGLPLGYQTSQLLALSFLDEFDHMVKEKYRVKYYGRYMDDFYLIVPTKKEAQQLLKDFREYMASVKLELNEKNGHLPTAERHRLFRISHLPHRDRRGGPKASQGQHPADALKSEVLGESLPGRGDFQEADHRLLPGVGRPRGPWRHLCSAAEVRKESQRDHRGGNPPQAENQFHRENREQKKRTTAAACSTETGGGRVICLHSFLTKRRKNKWHPLH